MSLNGLDDQKIKEAYDTAVAEPGGWFLLKYVARDEIDLLGRGNGGIVEVRNAIAQYEEPSPLFGFLRYRRRNVLIKYVPEECSRLVQARVTVHFNAVTERFSPHDTVFPITTSKELRDTTLSAACSLHTASGSISSSTSSLRQRRLMEIAEDEEEDLRTKRQSTVPEEWPPTAKKTSVSGAPPTVDLPELPLGLGLTPSISYQSSADTDGFPPPREVRPPSPTKSTAEPRNSSQSTRPDLYSYSSNGSSGRPKVKLGPRPSLDVSGRPHTSGASSYCRPVSTLPAGVKILARGGSQKDRPRTLVRAENPYMTISPPPTSPPPLPESTLIPAQDTLVRPHTSGGQPTSTSSMKSLVSPLAPTFPKTPTITPERARLLKAMEMRKKHLNTTPDPASPSPNPQMDEPTNSIAEDATHPDIEESLPLLDDAAKGDDSGIAFDASSILKTDESDATRSDSYAVSSVGPSEHAESTRASSISDSTAETVHETSVDKPLAKDDSVDLKVAGSDTSYDAAEIVETGNDDREEATQPDIKRESLQKLLPTTYNPLAYQMDTSEVTPAVTPAVVEIWEVVEEEHVPSYAPENVLGAKSAEEASAQVKDAPMDGIKIEPVKEELSTPVKVPTEEAKIKPAPDTVVEPSSPIKTWKVPRSKFSVQDLRAEQITHDIPTESLPASSSNMAIPAPEPSPVGSTFSAETRRSLEEDGHRPMASSKRKKRRGLVEPIRTYLDVAGGSSPNSDANFSSDDDLMDELQSAVFQEAKPISVSKSPLSPVFPNPQNRNGEQKFSRAFSQPFRKETSDPQVLGKKSPSQAQPGPLRSVSASAAYLDRINQQQAKPTPKKVNLGSGISQRIKALEKLSSLTPGSRQPTTAPSSRASTAFFSVRKSNARSPSKSPSIAERANSLTRNDLSSSVSRESSPEALKIRERSGSVKSRLDAFNSNPVPTNRAWPESISVTARIIRDPTQPFPAVSEAGKDPAEYAPLDLKQSPLVIDHQKAVPDPQKETIQERPLSKEKRLSNASKSTSKERRSSITVIKDIINDGRASFSERRRSINLEPSVLSPSNRSPSRPPSVHQSPAYQRPTSVSSRRNSRDLANGFSPPPTAGSISSASDDKSETKSTRASRMLRKLSSSLSSSRKTIAHAMSPTVREEFEPVNGVDAQSLESSQPSNNAVTMGEVNCQFPDSLLWKRRSMIVNSAGYLILSPALTAHSTGAGKEKTAGQAIRRFHLSEFRTPTIPDADMEELPNSVVLDFIEGGGLQVACEDRAGQGRILKILQDTHRVWAAYGQ